jgi:hypothetical protein
VSLDSADFGDGAFVPWSVTAGGPGLVAVGSTGAAEQISADDVAAVWTSVDGFTWSRVSHDEAVFPQGRMSSVTVGGPGLVAVGSTGTPNAVFLGEADVAVWTSVDGLVWARVPHEKASLGQGTMNSVTAGGPGLVAVGEDKDDAAVWTSVDGFTWSRVPHDEAVFGGPDLSSINYGAVSPASMASVTSGGPGLVAVGQDNGDAAVWTSVDGLIWSRVPADEAVFGGPNRQMMLGVTVGGPGFVAVGQDGPANNFVMTDYINAVVWTSVDGIKWIRVPHDEAVFGSQGIDDRQGMNSVIAGGPGLVAVGLAENGRDEGGAAVWVTVTED